MEKIIPRLSQENGIEDMALLTQRDLSVLAKTKTKIKAIYLVPVDIEGKRKYEIHLDVEGSKGHERCQIITSKNEPQRWTSINRAVEMLEGYTDTEGFIVVRTGLRDF